MPFAHPEHNVSKFLLRRSMHVADIGAGIGSYALALAATVPDGVVYAIDIQKDLLSKLKQEAVGKNLSNVEIVWGDAEVPGGTKLRDDSMDAVVVSNVLFQAEHKDRLLKEAYRITKPEGKLIVIDWIDSFGGLGPIHSHVLAPAEARLIAESVGWQHRTDFDPGEHHYGLQFIKKSQ